MRLIDTWTFDLREFDDDAIPYYSILSHTWDAEEVTFLDMRDLDAARNKKGFTKIARAAELANDEGMRWLWVDTCCIDKTSSAELQEAINSMWRWYRDAVVCFVFMMDLPRKMPYLTDNGAYRHPRHKRPLPLDSAENALVFEKFTGARWFTRGWCLQELIAPSKLRFYSLRPNGGKCRLIGDRSQLVRTISRVTNITPSILDKTAPLSSMSVAQRMSWAANRRTRRVEDQAYSLLGIFDVSMPMLYGEGKRAFIRLQEEIMKTYSDHSLFAWGRQSTTSDGSLLAASPLDFADASHIVGWGHSEPFSMTNRGLHLSVPLLSKKIAGITESLAILNCRYTDADEYAIALRLNNAVGGEEHHVLTRALPFLSPPTSEPRASRLATVHFKDTRLAKTTSFLISRTHERSSQSVRLKLHLDLNGADPSHSYVEDILAEQHSLTREVFTFYSTWRSAARVGVMLRYPSGRRFSLVFGFDRHPNNSLLPGVWAKFHRGPQRLDETIKLEPVHAHGRRFEACGKFATACPVMPKTAHASLFPEGDVLDASIEHERVFDEDVFTVKAVVRQVHELQACQPGSTEHAQVIPDNVQAMSQNAAPAKASPKSTPDVQLVDTFFPTIQRNIFADPDAATSEPRSTAAVLRQPYDQPDHWLLDDRMLHDDSTFMAFQALPFRFDNEAWRYWHRW